jgi:bd-type cytochrome oxidase subunit II
MLAGLILRGVAFEFRYKAERMRPVWDLGFAGGSLVAAFIQGMMVGALVEELPVANGRYVGGKGPAAARTKERSSKRERSKNLATRTAHPSTRPAVSAIVVATNLVRQ